jgi:hypothetical protein
LGTEISWGVANVNNYTNGVAVLSTALAIVAHRDWQAEATFVEITISGSTLAAQVADDVTPGTGSFLPLVARVGSDKVVGLFDETGDSDYDGAIITSDLIITTAELLSAPMFKPCSIDADGSNIYIAGLDSSNNPVLLKFPTSLDTDATIVYEPGAGTDIGVQCGRFDNDVIWAAGDFGAAFATVKSEDGGDNFTAADSQFTTITAFRVGPDSDERVLIADDNIDIYETIDDGTIWTLINNNIGFQPLVIERLDKNVQESVFGNSGNTTNNVNYSVNSGADLEDITSGFDKETDITGLEVG